jgi:pentatricopeptide repeat protein
MKRYPDYSIFWALLALKSSKNEAFFVPQFQSSHYGPGLTASKLSTSLSADNSYSSVVEADNPDIYQADAGISLLDFEKYTSILMDPGTVKLPVNVMEAAFEILMECSKEGTIESARKVEQLLKRLEEEDGDMLESKHYTVCAGAWAKSGHKKAAKRAEAVLNRMEELSKSNPGLAPTRSTFSVVLNAYSSQGDANSTYAILKRMENTPGITPVAFDFNAVLFAFSRRGQARRAEEVLKRMVDFCRANESSECAPNQRSYQLVLDSWAKSGDPSAGERAQEILNALQIQSEQGDLDLQPNERIYSTVLCSVIRSGQPDCVDQTQTLFDLALSKGIVPDQYMLASLMDAYAKVGNVEKAESLMKQLEEEGLANSVTYNTVIKAWKSSDSPDAPERAEAVLERMTTLGFADCISYTTVISAFANRGDIESAEKAEKLLKHMQELYRMGDTKVKPTTQTFNTGTY